jgi:hypothetical protein
MVLEVLRDLQVTDALELAAKAGNIRRRPAVANSETRRVRPSVRRRVVPMSSQAEQPGVE